MMHATKSYAVFSHTARHGHIEPSLPNLTVPIRDDPSLIPPYAAASLHTQTHTAVASLNTSHHIPPRLPCLFFPKLIKSHSDPTHRAICFWHNPDFSDPVFSRHACRGLPCQFASDRARTYLKNRNLSGRTKTGRSYLALNQHDDPNADESCRAQSAENLMQPLIPPTPP